MAMLAGTDAMAANLHHASGSDNTTVDTAGILGGACTC